MKHEAQKKSDAFRGGALAAEGRERRKSARIFAPQSIAATRAVVGLRGQVLSLTGASPKARCKARKKRARDGGALI